MNAYIGGLTRWVDSGGSGRAWLGARPTSGTGRLQPEELFQPALRSLPRHGASVGRTEHLARILIKVVGVAGGLGRREEGEGVGRRGACREEGVGGGGDGVGHCENGSKEEVFEECCDDE